MLKQCEEGSLFGRRVIEIPGLAKSQMDHHLDSVEFKSEFSRNPTHSI